MLTNGKSKKPQISMFRPIGMSYYAAETIIPSHFTQVLLSTNVVKGRNDKVMLHQSQ